MNLTKKRMMEEFGIDSENLVDRDYIKEHFMVLEYTTESPNFHKGGTDHYNKKDLIPKEEAGNVHGWMPALKVQWYNHGTGKKKYPKLILDQMVDTRHTSITDDYTLRPVTESDLDDLQRGVDRAVDSAMEQVTSIIDSIREFDSELKETA